MLVFVLFVHSFLAVVYAQNKKNVICYFKNDYGIDVSPPEIIDANLCTHVNYAFVALNDNGNLVSEIKSVDIDSNMYQRVVALKKSNPKLKVLISIMAQAKIFSQVAADSAKRQNFVNDGIKYCKTYGFDGIDVDWEVPKKNDSENFVILLKELRKALEKEGWLLTAAVYTAPSEGYNVPEIVKYLHMLNLMCYDCYGPWSAYTGHNSPLFSAAIESNYEKNHLNVAACISNWIKAGAPKNQVNAGVPFYGRSFTLADPNNHKVHSPIVRPGDPKSFTYTKICSTLNEYTTVWDDEQKVHYKYKGTFWLSYDDERSIEEKTKYIVSQNLAGIMIWHIGQDDVKGVCGQKQGLLRVVNNHLN